MVLCRGTLFFRHVELWSREAMGNNQVICKQCGCLNLEAEDHSKELSEGHEPKTIGLPTLESIEVIEPSMLVRIIDHNQ